jgi:Tol biopolymer transport system component
MLFLKHINPALAKFSLVFAVFFVPSCTTNASFPSQIKGVEEIKFASGEAISASDTLWDPTGNKIVISNYIAPTSKIYLLDLNNSETLLLYETGGSAGATDWTPDGRFITAFIDTKDGEGIWNLDPNNIKPPAFITTGHEASWSPDGTKLAVWDHSPWILSGENTEKLRIIDMQSKKEDVVFEVKGKDFLATGLAWSTSGEYIAFSLSIDHQASQIYLLDMNTNVALKITDDENDHWSPSWSPDSQLVAYVSMPSKSSESSIMISTIDGKCKVAVPGIANMWAVAWSPNGKQLLFDWRNTKIYLVDLYTIFGKDILTEGINCSY